MSLRVPAINQVTLTGRLVQDCEFRITDNGTARVTGRLAVNRSYRRADGSWEGEASFFQITIWAALAERLADSLRKGTSVFISGRLRSHSWRDDDDKPHSLVEIVVRNLQVLDSKDADAPTDVIEVADERNAA